MKPAEFQALQQDLSAAMRWDSDTESTSSGDASASVHQAFIGTSVEEDEGTVSDTNDPAV